MCRLQPQYVANQHLNAASKNKQITKCDQLSSATIENSHGSTGVMDTYGVRGWGSSWGRGERGGDADRAGDVTIVRDQSELLTPNRTAIMHDLGS